MQLAALECADEVDPVAQQIGAVNTLVRQEDGTLKGYNTDWSAAITAIEDGLQPSTRDAAESSSSPHSTNGDSLGSLGAEEATTSGRVFEEGQGKRQSESVLKGRTVVVIGAGGAGRALAFGAAHKGAKVVIANRSVCFSKQLYHRLTIYRDSDAAGCVNEAWHLGIVCMLRLSCINGTSCYGECYLSPVSLSLGKVPALFSGTLHTCSKLRQ